MTNRRIRSSRFTQIGAALLLLLSCMPGLAARDTASAVERAATSGVPAQAASWTALSSGTTNALRSVRFINDSEGWAAGQSGALLKTSNGGANWSAVNTGLANGQNNYVTVHFLNQNAGWAGSANWLARTLDGGATWQAYEMPAGVNNATTTSVNAYFPLSDTQVRWAAGGLMNGTKVGFSLLATVDPANPGGMLLGGTPHLLAPSNPSLSRYINDFAIVPGAGAWYVMEDGGSAKFSESGAFTALSISTPTHLYAIQMLNANVGYVAGAGGLILKTTTGGAWTPQTSGVSAALRDVFFLDELRGWAVGDNGTILTTADGGAAWTPEASGTAATLQSIHCPSANACYAAGTNGVLLKRAIAAPAALASVSAASFAANAALAPDSIAAAFGSNLAPATLTASSLPLPTTLAGVTVKVKDSANAERNAPLFFVSPTQINYQLPAGTAAGAATITVLNASGAAVAQGAATIAGVAPGLFSANASGQGLPAGVVLRIKANGANGEQLYEPLAQFDAAQNRFVAVPIDLGAESDQVFVILYGTGFRNRGGLSAVAMKLGGADAEVLFAGAVPGFAGLDQLNVRVPRGLKGRGEVDVALTVNGAAGNGLRVTIK